MMRKKNKKTETTQEKTNPETNVIEDVLNQENTEQSKGEKHSEDDMSNNKISEFEEKAKEFQDKYLRLSAEFDNYRKRTLKEKMDMMKTAGEDIMLKILPVVDDFERALKAIDAAKDIDAVKSGVTLIYNKFQEFLLQRGVKPIESVHKEFDTDLHEALTKIPAPDENLKGKIIDEIEKGYYMHDKVIRFAKVVVGE